MPHGVAIALQAETSVRVVACSQNFNNQQVRDRGQQAQVVQIPVGSACVCERYLVHGGMNYDRDSTKLHFYATGTRGSAHCGARTVKSTLV